MTSPQDPSQPSQPDQPGTSGPGAPAGQGWGQQPQTPPWGAPTPAGQPGWGASPPATPPAWGTPPVPPQQPGWGPPQGWAPPPAKSKRKGCLVALAVVLIVALLGVGGCVYLVATTIGPAIGTELTIQSNSGGQIASGNYNWNNGVGVFTFTAASGVTQAQARDLACRVVKPALRGTQFENTHFVIYSAYGDWLADETTPCT